MKIFSALLCSALLCSAAFASDGALPKQEPYPNLNSTADGSPAKCALQPEEAGWLEARMKEGKIRLATPEDIKAWENLAKKKKRPVQEAHLDCGRTFVILKEIEVPKKVNDNPFFALNILFIVPADVSFPIVHSGAPILDLKNGGWLQSGSCDDGEKQGIGRSARECE